MVPVATSTPDCTTATPSVRTKCSQPRPFSIESIMGLYSSAPPTPSERDKLITSSRPQDLSVSLVRREELPPPPPLLLPPEAHRQVIASLLLHLVWACAAPITRPC